MVKTAKSKFMVEMEKRNKRYAEVQEVMNKFAEAAKKEDSEFGYAYMCGYLQSMIASLAADSKASTEDVINQLKNSSVMKGV
jgi:hypothetical protein